MGSIVTFYSYKGGVGRSMVLANVAVLLAQARNRVLVVDWDLEAPGLERYFHYFTRSTSAEGAGLLPMLIEATAGDARTYQEHVEMIDVGSGTPLTLLGSGREQEPALYARWLEEFDWHRFFRKGGGDYLEDLRRSWKREFDIVLIDSRTGLSDTGGVCTIQMPDVLVVMFTANYQSMLGARDVMRLARQARQALAYPRMQLTVFPLPARFGSRSPSDVTKEWLVRFADAFAEFFEDWLPAWAKPEEILDRVKVPQTDDFGFGEQLAVMEEGIDESGTIGHACDQIARVLRDDFRSAHDVLELRERVSAPAEIESPKGYEWDLFVSYQGASFTLLEHFVTDLRDELSMYGLQIYIDRQELKVGRVYEAQLAEVLRRSKILLPIVTPAYFRSRWALAEWQSFEERERRSHIPLIVPVLLRGSINDLPPGMSTRQFFDLTRYTTLSSKHEHASAVDQLSRRIGDLISSVPPYQPDFPVIKPDEVELPPAPHLSLPRLS